MKAVFLDLATLGESVSTSSLRQAHADWDFHLRTETDQVPERIADATILVCNKAIISSETMRQAKSLEIICVIATGTNNVDLAAAKDFGIAVTNVTGYGTASVVQHVFALLLALTTNLLNHDRLVRSGAWQRATSFCLFDFPITELAGKTIGIVGYGELGAGVASAAKAFGMQVLIAQGVGNNTDTDRLPLDVLLPQVDVLSLHVPLAENTKNLIGKDRLALMKPDALLINCARGGVVDEAALAHALRHGVIGGAGVDVLTTEPPTRGNPLLDPSIPNLIVTPHIAWASRQARQRLLDDVAKTIEAFHQGRIRNHVNA